MATTTASYPPSPDIPHTPVSNEGAVDVPSKSIMQAASEPSPAESGGRRSVSIDAPRRRSRGSKSGTGSGGIQSPVVSVMKIEGPAVRSRSRSRSRSISPKNQARVAGNVLENGHGHGHVAELELELDGRRVSVVSGVGVAVASPPKEHLPPSPPLTRVGTNDSLREAARSGAGRKKRGDKEKEKAARTSDDEDRREEGNNSNWAAKELGSDGDFNDVENVEEDAGLHSPTHQTGPAPNFSDIPMFTSYSPGPPPQAQAQSSSRPQTGATTSRPQTAGTSAEAKLADPLSPLPSPTRSHPLYRPPSPQPWDLVDPPPDNNAHATGSANVTVRSKGSRGTVGTAADGGDIEQLQELGSTRSVRSVNSGLGGRQVVEKDGKRYRIPQSSYYFGPPPETAAFGTDPIGQIGVHHPREVVRIERDYSGGDLVQFSPAYPLELEGRIKPTLFLETINTINEMLISAHSLKWSFLDNALAIFTLQISRLFFKSHYDREMGRLQNTLAELNKEYYNPSGLNILWPKDVAFMFLEIEYY